MSKKNKRQSSRPLARPVVAQTSRANEFNPDYTTTKHELRRIGILASAFIAVLIVLAIFQNQILSLFIK